MLRGIAEVIMELLFYEELIGALGPRSVVS